VRLPTRDDADLVGVRRHVFVSEPAIGDDVRAGFDRSTDEAMQGVRDPHVMCSSRMRQGCPSPDNSAAPMAKLLPTGHFQNIT